MFKLNLSKLDLLKYSKNFPEFCLGTLLAISSKLKGYEFETGKAIIRHGVKIVSKSRLIDILLTFDSTSRTKLLGYLHLQLFKLNKNEDSKALLKALQNADGQESLLYLVRVCSKKSDFILFEEQHSTETISFTTGIGEGVVVRPGQVIEVSDPVRAGVRRGGRISAATTTTITVDNTADTDLDATNNATVSVVLPNGTVEKGVVAVSYTHLTLPTKRIV